MIRLMGEPNNSVRSPRASDVLGTTHSVDRHGIEKDTVKHVLHDVPRTESPPKLNITL